MKRVSATAVIAASPRRVWDLYADVKGSVRWVPFMEAVVSIDGPPGLGQTYRERTRLGGVSGVSEWRIVEWDPPRRQVQLSTDMRMDARLVIEIEAVDASTRVTQSTLLDSRLPGPLGWLHERIVGIVTARGVAMAVRGAKRHLEGGGASRSVGLGEDERAPSEEVHAGLHQQEPSGREGDRHDEHDPRP